MNSLPFSRFLRLFVSAGAVFTVIFLAACGAKSANQPLTRLPRQALVALRPAAEIRLAYIAKGKGDVYWQSVEKGARQAEKEINAARQPLEVIWDAPAKDGDRATQLDMVESYVGQNMDGIILCPVDNVGLVPAAEKAHQAKIPLVIVDSDLDDKDRISFVATDNFKGGQIAGEELAHEISFKGSVVMLRFNAGSASCEEREKGFLDAMGKHPEITVISSNQYAGPTRESAIEKGQNLLNSLNGQEIDGVFTPNESSTNGMMIALEKAGLQGKVKFVGFDGGTANLQGLQDGHINALVLQNPYMMGYLGVKMMMDHLNGKKVEPRVDTGATLVTKDNYKSDEVQTLLKNTVQ